MSHVKKFGDVANGDYTEIEDDGSLIAHGDATMWDDQHIDWGQLSSGGWFGNDFAQPVELASGIAIEFENSTSSGYKTCFNVQLYHRYTEGSDIEFHIHIRDNGTGTGNAVFKLTYQWANAEATFPSSTTVTKTIAIDGTDGRHQMEEIASTISGTGKTISSILMCTLERLASDSNDTFSGSVYVIAIDFHIETNSLGSKEQTTK
jgi:hypothetical protein